MLKRLWRWLTGGRMQPVPATLTVEQALDASLRYGFYAVQWEGKW